MSDRWPPADQQAEMQAHGSSFRRTNADRLKTTRAANSHVRRSRHEGFCQHGPRRRESHRELAASDRWPSLPYWDVHQPPRPRGYHADHARFLTPAGLRLLVDRRVRAQIHPRARRHFP